MNAEPLLEPLLNAVRRGVIVSCYLCLGYNDAGELLPFQNGTNEMIANRLYNALQSDEEKAKLRVSYYVAKDQTMPIHNNFKKRSCHIKLMVVDEQVAIQGGYSISNTLIYDRQYRDFPLTLFLSTIRQRKPRYTVLLPQPGN
jgi:phosphatidylserine/phosphatidylglycerophosphate/cardiolipin synthase-like enzyme